MIEKFKEFEQYAKIVKDALENVTHDYSMGEEEKLSIIYATPPVAFAKYKQNTVNGQKPGPLISFYLSGVEIPQEEQLGGFCQVLLEKKYGYRAPIIAKLHYKITINAIKESQADLLQSQIIMAMPFNRPYATNINGQWATLEAKDFENESNVEIESDKDKVSTRTGTIEIARAYFDYPIQVNDKFIKGVNSHIYSIEKLSRGKNENSK